MKKQEKNEKRSASVFGRFCSAIALCTIIVTLAATALPIIALAVRSISDRPAAGAADEGSNIRRNGTARFFAFISLQTAIRRRIKG